MSPSKAAAARWPSLDRVLAVKWPAYKQHYSDAGSFIATLNSRSAHGSGDFDESTFSRSKRGLGGGFGGFNGGLDQPVQVTVRQEMQIEAEDDDFGSVSGKGASNAGVSVGGAFPVASQLPGSTYRVQFDESPKDVGMGKHSAMAA